MKKFNKSVVVTVAIFGLLVGAGNGLAEIIANAGLDTTTLGNWRTTTTAKLLDIDNNNVYGSAGYFVFSTGGGGSQGTTQPFQTTYDKNGLPSWVALTANGANGDYAGAYGLIDDPSLAPGPIVGDIQGGYTWRAGVTANTTTSLFNLTFGPSTPSGTIRIGIMLNSGSGTVNSITLKDASNSLITATQLVGVQSTYPNYAFFDVTNAANDVITISGNYAAAGSDGLSGITFDTPEPASASLLMISGSLALLRRRRA